MGLVACVVSGILWTSCVACAPQERAEEGGRLQAEVAALHAELRNATEENAKLHGEFRTKSRAELDEQQRELRRLEGENAELEDELRAALCSQQAACEEAAQLGEERSRLQTEMRRLREDEARLRAELSAEEKRRPEALRTIKLLRGEVESLRRMIKAQPEDDQAPPFITRTC